MMEADINLIRIGDEIINDKMKHINNIYLAWADDSFSRGLFKLIVTTVAPVG